MKRREFAILVIAMMAAAFAGSAAMTWLTTATIVHGQETLAPYSPANAAPQSRSSDARRWPPTSNAASQRLLPNVVASAASQVVTARGIQLVDASGRVRLSLEVAPELPPGTPGSWGQSGPSLLLRGDRGEVLWTAPERAEPRTRLLAE